LHTLFNLFGSVHHWSFFLCENWLCDLEYTQFSCVWWACLESVTFPRHWMLMDTFPGSFCVVYLHWLSWVGLRSTFLSIIVLLFTINVLSCFIFYEAMCVVHTVQYF
jgi:hypothetical protein